MELTIDSWAFNAAETYPFIVVKQVTKPTKPSAPSFTEILSPHDFLTEIIAFAAESTLTRNHFKKCEEWDHNCWLALTYPKKIKVSGGAFTDTYEIVSILTPEKPDAEALAKQANELLDFRPVASFDIDKRNALLNLHLCTGEIVSVPIEKKLATV